ncbi:MAG: ATP-binding protein [Candidatus Omnitrophota bacterium]|nr:ATP-binding protein [Candidatus Omnitrophota bacterium]
MLKELLSFSSYHFNPHAVPVIGVSLLIFSIGIFIFFQAKKLIKNAAFFFLCTSLSLWLLGTGIVYLSANPDTALFWYKYFTFLGVINIMPSAYLFSAASSGSLRKQRGFVALSFFLAYLFYFLAIATDKSIGTPRLYFWGYYPVYKPLNFLFLLCYSITYIAIQINLWFTYKSEEIPIKKTQVLIIFIGFLVGFAASFDFVAKIWPIRLYPFGFIPIFVFTCMLAYSVIRHKAFDIETVIHKTAGWFLASSSAFIPIIIFAYWLKPWYRKAPASEVALLCGGIFYLLTVYIRYTQPKIDHFFQRRKYNLEDISSKFSEDLVHLKGLNQLIARIDDVIKDTLYPKRTDIFIYNEAKKRYLLANWKNSIELEGNKFLSWLSEHNKIAYRDFVPIDPEYSSVRAEAEEYFRGTAATLVIPLVLNEKLLGIINLDKKANLKRYTAADLHFLATLKNQSAIAISNSLVYENIEEQVRQRTEELVAVQKQLVQAEKLATVGTLAGGVAHEINNPLTAILTNVQMMLMDEPEAKIDREVLELIEEATKRCRSIVQKLMVYARKPLESSDVSSIDVLRAAENVIAFLAYQLEQENVKILFSAKKDGSFMINGNRGELEQVLTNIILNAKDAIRKTKKSGNIDILLSKTGSSIILEVKDGGAGIPKEIITKIFDPFFTTKDVGQGLGLGLSISHAIVEKHNGSISVESELDKGSKFTIKLPMAKTETKTESKV